MGVGRGANVLLAVKQLQCYKRDTYDADLHLSFGTTKAMEKGHEFGTWNVRSLYKSGSLTAAARDLPRLLMGVQEIRLGKGRTERAGDYIFIHGKAKANYKPRRVFFTHHRIV